MLDITKTIQQLRSRVPEFILTDVVNIESGLSIAGDSLAPDFDASIASAAYADVVKANQKALNASGLKAASTEDILITTDRMYILIRILGSDYYHVLIIGREGNLGLARAIMKKYQPDLIESLRDIL